MSNKHENPNLKKEMFVIFAVIAFCFCMVPFADKLNTVSAIHFGVWGNDEKKVDKWLKVLYNTRHQKR